MQTNFQKNQPRYADFRSSKTEGGFLDNINLSFNLYHGNGVTSFWIDPALFYGSWFMDNNWMN